MSTVLMRSASGTYGVPVARAGHHHLVPLRVVLLLVMVCTTTGCAGLTAREKGALIGGAGGAAGGALLGSAAGSAALGAAIGGPVGLVGGYLLGDHFFANHSRRQTSQGRGYSSRTNGQSRTRARSSVTAVQSGTPPRGDDEPGRVF